MGQARLQGARTRPGAGPAAFGFHSLRRGGWIELQMEGASLDQLMAALCHRSERSTAIDVC